MAVQYNVARYGITGTLLAFILLVFLFWYSVVPIKNLRNEIEYLKKAVEEGEVAEASLKFKLEGTIGCKQTLVDYLAIKKKKETEVPGKEKEATDKRAVVLKAEEELKKMKEEHPKAKAAYEKLVADQQSLNGTCTKKVDEANTECAAAAKTKQKGEKSLLARFLGNK